MLLRALTGTWVVRAFLIDRERCHSSYESSFTNGRFLNECIVFFNKSFDSRNRHKLLVQVKCLARRLGHPSIRHIPRPPLHHPAFQPALHRPADLLKVVHDPLANAVRFHLFPNAPSTR